MENHADILVENEKCIRFIQSNISQTSILIQLAEECNEVAQQALKLVRIYNGENPTPATATETSQKLNEEIADFYACLNCLSGVDYNRIEEIQSKKLNRWCTRLAKYGNKRI